MSSVRMIPYQMKARDVESPETATKLHYRATGRNMVTPPKPAGNRKFKQITRCTPWTISNDGAVSAGIKRPAQSTEKMPSERENVFGVQKKKKYAQEVGGCRQIRTVLTVGSQYIGQKTDRRWGGDVAVVVVACGKGEWEGASQKSDLPAGRNLRMILSKRNFSKFVFLTYLSTPANMKSFTPVKVRFAKKKKNVEASREIFVVYHICNVRPVEFPGSLWDS